MQQEWLAMHVPARKNDRNTWTVVRNAWPVVRNCALAITALGLGAVGVATFMQPPDQLSSKPALQQSMEGLTDRAFWEKTFPGDKELIGKAFERGFFDDDFDDVRFKLYFGNLKYEYLGIPEAETALREEKRAELLGYLRESIAWDEGGRKTARPHLFETPPALRMDANSPNARPLGSTLGPGLAGGMSYSPGYELRKKSSFEDVSTVMMRWKGHDHDERIFAFCLSNKSDRSCTITRITISDHSTRNYVNDVKVELGPGKSILVGLLDVPPAKPSDSSRPYDDTESYGMIITYETAKKGGGNEAIIERGILKLMPQNTIPLDDVPVGSNPPPPAGAE
ncbi:MAG: hypothetical protein Q7T16_02200 [Candidatus Burarchaeum sp.]|nr:hypothetical protein [Candidatus Burarchaeum sp.]MDO8339446.1 hypothetical protein [Candidatus Burarchaeum sp.]